MGTVVSFDILVHLTEAAQTRLQPKQRVVGLAPDQPQYRILVVEDNWESRQLLVKMLSSLGFEVLSATNGQEGVEISQTKAPHLILMDMRMPVMNGYEATQRIRSSLPGQGAVIIALTAYALDEKKAAIMAAGCDDFITKPFCEQLLLEKIAAHLGVRYTYEALSIPAKESAVNKKLLTSEDFQIMSEQWQRQLNEAARNLQEEHVIALIEQIPQENAEIKVALKDLVYDFRLDIIANLTAALLASH
ncbi:MAG: response regulator [Nostocaceae cyanobacterium]|nr:response regulator [Nostocaceae cyanobacterium]